MNFCDALNCLRFNSESKPKGISVHWLKYGFLDEVKEAGLDESNPIYKIENLSQVKNGVIRNKGKDVICPHDGKNGAAYVDCVSGKDNVGPATIMLSYGWGNSIGDIVDTLTDYCNSYQLEFKRTYIWICCLCVNQHRVAENKRNGVEVQFQEFHDIFRDRVTGIGHVVAMMSPWDKPVYLTRLWCIFELYTANENEHCEVTIAMPSSDRKKMIEAITNINVLYEALGRTKVQDAKASEKADRERILEIVEKGPGFSGLNNQVNDLLRQWVKDRIIEAVQSYEAEATDISSDAEFASLCSKVGYVMQNQGESDDALILHKKSLKIRQKALGEKHHETAVSHNNIGMVLENKGDYDTALVQLKTGLTILKMFKENSDTATSYYGIGFVLAKKGEYEEALEMYKKSLEIRKKVLGQNHPDTATCYNNIGTVLRDEGESKEALDMYRKALTIRKNVLGNDHPDTAISHNHLGFLLGKKGKFSDALIELRQALAIREKVLGTDHRETATSHHNIGVVLGNKGELSEALEELKIGLEIRQKVLGFNRRATADSHDSIGIVLGKQGLFSIALLELRKGLEIRQKVLGEDHPVTSNSKVNIDVVLKERKINCTE